MGAAGRETVAVRFSPERLVADIDTLYRNALAQKRSTRAPSVFEPERLLEMVRVHAHHHRHLGCVRRPGSAARRTAAMR
jgi:hypothetical protein